MAQGLADSHLVRSGYGCNNACRFCRQGSLRTSQGDLADDEIEQAVRAAARQAVGPRSALLLSGGEITLRDALPDWVEIARELGARRVIVQTNGRRLGYRRYAERLVAAGTDAVAIAVHGHVAACHDWLTRAPSSFDQTLAGITNARAAGATVLTNTVITRSNFRHLRDIVRLAVSRGAAAVRFLWPIREGWAADFAPSIVPNLELVRPYLEQATTIARSLGARVSVELGGAAAAPPRS